MTSSASSTLLDPSLRALSVLALGVVLACGDSTSSEGDLDRALENAVDGRIIPAMTSLARDAGDLRTEADTFCSSPTEAGLSRLQAAWGRLSLTWNGAMIYNVGPLDDDIIVPSILFIESMRQRGIDYTNTVRESIDEALASDVPLDQAYFDGLAFNEIGMLALEILVFESATSTRSTALEDIVARYDAEPRTCAYLEGVASRLARRAATVRDGWTTAFGETGTPFREIFLSGELPDGAEPAPQLIGVIIDHLVYIQRRKLEGILDAKLSGLFFANQASTLAEIEALFEGSSSPDGYGFFDVMIDRGFAEEVDQVRADLVAAGSAAEAETRSGLAGALRNLEVDLREVVPDALGIELGIEFADGD